MKLLILEIERFITPNLSQFSANKIFLSRIQFASIQYILHAIQKSMPLYKTANKTNADIIFSNMITVEGVIEKRYGEFYDAMMEAISKLIGISAKKKPLQRILAYKSLTKTYFKLQRGGAENEKE